MITLVMTVMGMATVVMVTVAMPGMSTPSQSTRPLTPPCSASAAGWDRTTTRLMPALSQITLPAAPLALLLCKTPILHELSIILYMYVVL